MCNPSDTTFSCFHEEVFIPALESFADSSAPVFDTVQMFEGPSLSRNSSALLPGCGSTAWDQDFNTGGLDGMLEQASFEVLAGTETVSNTFDDWAMVEPEPAKFLDTPPSASVWSAEIDSLLSMDEPETPSDSESESLLSRTSTPNGSKRSEIAVVPAPASLHTSSSISTDVSAPSSTQETEKDNQPVADDQPVARGRGGKPRSRKNAKPYYWTGEDHKKFLAGLEKFGLHESLGPGGAELVAMFMGSRTPLQVRSHAQKYFSELGLAR